jgi:aryl-alcohol dehydrogenase-like predicted oxidoreductase
MTGDGSPPFRLGFGCASLGSRISAADGLRALEAAHEAGVNWFDLAPAYGDGEAELVFSRFARDRRGRIHICTKVGLLPPMVSAIARAARPLARRVVAVAPPLRRWVARSRRVADRPTLTSNLIQTSLEASLRRLDIETVDAFALHDPLPDDLEREDVQRALEDIRRSGKALRIGVAGAPSSVSRAAGMPGVDLLQFASDLDGVNVARMSEAARVRDNIPMIVTHSVGAAAARGLASASSTARRRAGETLRTLGYDMPADRALYAAALDLALHDNAHGVVLASMNSPEHLALNLRRVEYSIARPYHDIRSALHLLNPSLGEDVEPS